MFGIEQAIFLMTELQDPDVVYVSSNKILWEPCLKSEDPLNTDWTGHQDLYCLDEATINTIEIDNNIDDIGDLEFEVETIASMMTMEDV